MSTTLISLAEARSKNLLKYFTGKPCKSGHISERYTSGNNCLACLAANDRKQYTRKRSPEFARKKNLWRNHRVRPEQVDKMMSQQDNRCAICLAEFKDSPHVDHCHATGIIRGLLCMHCNLMLGHARDNAKTLTRAIAYLRRYK